MLFLASQVSLAGTGYLDISATSSSSTQAGEWAVLQGKELNVDKPEENTEQNAAGILLHFFLLHMYFKYWPALQI